MLSVNFMVFFLCLLVLLVKIMVKFKLGVNKLVDQYKKRTKLIF